MPTNKIYSNQTLKWWLHWFFDIDNKHITMRLAWNPSLLLEQYRERYWKEWDKKYIELLEMFKVIWENGKSPFVFYINNFKTKNEKV